MWKVGCDVGEDVNADEIGEAKGPGARPSDGGTSECIDFFNCEALFEHQVRGVEHDGDADAIGDEIVRVVREDDLLAEKAVGEGRECGEDGGIGVGSGDDLKQAHVARGIKEVRAKEFFLDLDRQYGGNLRYGQAGGVGGKQRVRGEMRHDAREQRRFDFKIFGDGFNDPVAFREAGQIFVEVAGGDEANE